MSVNEIASLIRKYACSWIVWTGGEPSLQLNDEILSYFKKEGYLQAIESNGTRKLSALLDYRVISPKGDPACVKLINPEVDEIRLPVEAGDEIPGIGTLPDARFYFLSPVFREDEKETRSNIAYCVDFIKQNPVWRLSLQIHKLIGIE